MRCNGEWVMSETDFSISTLESCESPHGRKYKPLDLPVDSPIRYGIIGRHQLSICLVIWGVTQAAAMARMHPSMLFVESTEDEL